ncbi:MAG TPA: hypothetical protein VGV37_28900, partial [Aliidongia sp.]|uniref:hypothetical protein n=1 Tax=Aliidongia sp. TaxID=1914230 RepID=UPI002DDD8750
ETINQSPAPIRLHYITWLTKNAHPKRRVFPHAAACASLPVPTMSNNNAFFAAEPLESCRPRRQRTAGFYARLRTKSTSFLHSLVSFFFAAAASVRGFVRKDQGDFPGRKRSAEPASS